MKIKACPRCGSTELSLSPGEAFSALIYSGNIMCKKCGYIGTPIEFDSKKDYEEFIKFLKNQR